VTLILTAARRLLLCAAVTGATVCAPVPGANAPSPTYGEPLRTPGLPVVIPTERPVFWVEAPLPEDPSPILAQIPRTGVVVEGSTVRLLRPPIANTPRRVAVQAGHWRTSEAPSEFPSLPFSSGASVFGVTEVAVTLDIAQRVVDLLTERGIVADLLPATVPPSYLADVFVSLHADADVTGTANGAKIAHGFYRSRSDPLLVETLTEHYLAGTGLRWDTNITGAMTDYYAFAWFRYEHALAPHTAAAIVEMGFISHPTDRALLLAEPDRVARAIAEGILRFLDAVPRAVLFGDDIVVPTATAPPVSPTSTP